MGRRHSLFLVGIIAALLNGCAFVQVPLFSPPKPLQEKVVEGEGRKKILLLDISGVISEREKSDGLLAKGTSSMIDLTREALKKAEDDADIAGVIVRLNSPGGTVTASDIIRHDIAAFKERKKVPVFACIMSVGASGAYYIATAADEIIAHLTAVTGSIGVLLMKFDLEGLLEKVGVREQTIKSGSNKDILSPFRKTTPEELKLVQAIIDQLYERFLDMVIARPKNTLSRSELRILADGRIYSAQQALDVKLIDKIGYLDDVIFDMKRELAVEHAQVVIYNRPGSYKGSIYAETAGEAATLANLFSISGGADLFPESRFMYLWQP